ncbi:hypothetical protein [Microbispora sp. H10670]|uniref:hypothetical protein n=1 Tax=Microbispora sp. H10670 TaxID=2729108 RepID=UPI001602C7F0|nr:hypothetical protein [Microbispora sp. H10670]
MRLHDLWHGVVTLALAAHVDLPVVQDQVGHASIVFTADTYTSVLPDIGQPGRRRGWGCRRRAGPLGRCAGGDAAG